LRYAAAAALLNPPPNPPVGRSLRQAVKAARYWVAMPGRVVGLLEDGPPEAFEAGPPEAFEAGPPEAFEAGPLEEPEALEAPEPPEALEAEAFDPDPARRPPNPEDATFAGTPWLSRHWVNLLRAAANAAAPPDPATPDPEPDPDEPEEPEEPDALEPEFAAVVVDEEEVLVELPQAAATAARATRQAAKARITRLRRDSPGLVSITNRN
jgi:hypothetical protein